MASIRRTLSPAHHHQNGAVNSPLSLSSPSQKFSSSNGKPSSSSSSSVVSALVSSLRRSITAGFSQKRKGVRWASRRCLLFFLLGILLGVFPSSHVELPETPLRGEIIKRPRVDEQLDVNGSENSAQSITTVSLEVEAKSKYDYDYLPRKQLIVVTPTYNRATQAYFLNRQGQALRLVQPPLVWIVVESGTAASQETAEILRKTGVMYRHLVCNKNLTDVKDRGVHQRNAAMEHIERHRLDGIVYFADDDNVYTLELFESLRQIR